MSTVLQVIQVLQALVAAGGILSDEAGEALRLINVARDENREITPAELAYFKQRRNSALRDLADTIDAMPDV